MKKKITAILLVVALVVTLGATGAFAAVVSTQDGDVCGPDISSYTTRVYIIDNSASKIDANPVIVAAPSNVTLHVYESDTETRVFNEAQNVSVTSLAYDGGTYTGNVDSHLVHQEPTMGEPGVPTPTPYADAMRGRGCIEFYTDIIGVIISDADLDASDSVLGLSTTTYPTGQVNRGLEMGSARGYQDIIEIDGKVLKIDLQSAEVMDQIRVLTEPVNPSIEITKSTTWTGFATIGDEIDYTYDVHNDGNVSLDNVSVTDDKAGSADPVMDNGHNVGDDNENDLLDPCETWQFTASYTVVESDLNSCTLENTGTATAYYEDEEVTDTDDASVDLAKIIILCAGQHIPVGTVTVVNDGTELTVTYQTTGGWLMTELHLHVAETELDGDEWDISGIPQTQPNKKGLGGGNPIPGHFDENVEFDPPTDFWEKTYDLDEEGWVGCETDLVIAAHAVVVFFDETCIDFEAYSEFDTVGIVGTPNGDVNFYMTDYTPLAALAVGEYAALAPSGDLPVVASPGTNDNPPSTYPNIVAFTTDGSPYTEADDIVLEDNGTGAGGNTLTDPQDTSQTELMWHAYSQFLGIVIDVTGLDWVEDLGLVTIDLDHGELWHFLYFDADGILIHKDTIAAGTGSYDGEAFPISWTDDAYSIAKVVVFGEMNNNVAGIVGYAIDNICITSVVQEETAWAGGQCDTKENVKDFPGANWATYFTYHVMLCNGD